MERFKRCRKLFFYIERFSLKIISLLLIYRQESGFWFEILVRGLFPAEIFFEICAIVCSLLSCRYHHKASIPFIQNTSLKMFNASWNDLRRGRECPAACECSPGFGFGSFSLGESSFSEDFQNWSSGCRCPAVQQDSTYLVSSILLSHR